MAGIWGGCQLFFTLLVTLCFPSLGIAALYLEEFAPIGSLRLSKSISIIWQHAFHRFGLLGLAVFLNFLAFRVPPRLSEAWCLRLTLPTIIIASRAALKAVPPSIRDAALGVGASKQQAVFHHVLPLAMPGMTGTIIGMAQALGETAPLLMIGMVAFVVDIPGGFTDPATVQFRYLCGLISRTRIQQKTAAAIMVL